MKQKMLIIHPIIAPYRIDFFNSLSETYDCTICLTWENLHDQTFDYSQIEKLFRFVPKFLTKKILGYPTGLLKTFRETKPDIILVSECGIVSMLMFLVSRLCHRKVKVVSMIDDSYDMVVSDNHFTNRHKYAEKIMIPLFDNIICVEPRVTDYYKKRYHKGIYFPIIADEELSVLRYKRIIPISERYIQDYSLAGRKVILVVGRLVEIKNVQFVISTLKDINDPSLRFVIVGSGDYEQTLFCLAKEDDRIIFTGRKEGDDLYAWYNIANIFVLPSFKEPFGAVTNEALIGGCRCLVSNRAGSQCLIDKTNGKTFDPYDRTSFKTILMEEMSKVQPISSRIEHRASLMNISFKKAMSNVTHNI